MGKNKESFSDARRNTLGRSCCDACVTERTLYVVSDVICWTNAQMTERNINNQSNQIACVTATMKAKLKFKTVPRSSLAEGKLGFKAILDFSDAELTTE